MRPRALSPRQQVQERAPLGMHVNVRVRSRPRVVLVPEPDQRAPVLRRDDPELRPVYSEVLPRARKLRKLAESEQQRAQIIDQVHAGELSKPEAAEELGVSVARVNQILRRRRAGEADQFTAASIAKIDSPRGRRTYARRAGTIEPVFAQIKHNRKIRTISRRGLTAADSEWKLICATHNLLKLHRLA